MRFFSFNLSHPVHYFMGGEFTSHKQWVHQKRYRKGDYEIIFCINGPLYLQVGAEQLTVNDNSLLIVPPYQELVGFKPSEKAVDFYWVHFFPQDDVKSYEGSLSDFTTVYSTTKDHVTLPMLFTVTQENDILIELHQLISTNSSRGSVQKRDFLVSILLIDLFEDFNDDFSKHDDHARLKYIREYITTNMSATLSVESVAEGVHLNRNYLTRLFKKYLGVTTSQYITKLKLEVASLLLLRTDMPVKAIANEAFFSNCRVFMRRFKAVKGISPTQHRRYQSVHSNSRPYRQPN